MRHSNEQFLQMKYYHWATLRDAGFIKDLSNDERQELLRILREEWEPRALYCLTCMEDVAKLLTNVYTQFDKYLASKPKEELKKKKR